MTTAKAATVEGRPLPEITSHTLQSFPALPGSKVRIQTCGQCNKSHHLYTLCIFDIHAKVEDSLHVKLRKDVEVR